MKHQITRRNFIWKTSATAAGVFFIGKASSFGRNKISPNDKLNIACIGTANRAAENIKGVEGENIVALCDVDELYLGKAKANHASAKTYSDFRRLIDQKDIDAIVVATTDHTHAVATAAAIKSGRHAYCEKPLTHTISECRRIQELARQHKCVTQMGTQIHATDNYRRVVEVIQSGAIGKVKEVHVWVGRVYNFPGNPPLAPVPKNLNWDLWLGPVSETPYSPEYVPMWWRKFWHFGGGTLSDMACHHMDLSHWALGIHTPLTVETEGPTVDAITTPSWLTVHYQYPETKTFSGKLNWYHGEKDGKLHRPPQFADGSLPKWDGDGSLFIGEKGMLLADYGRYVLLPEKDFTGFTPPPQTIAPSKGHHAEWIHAIKNGGTTLCNFDYSGDLSESVLLGNVAFRVGKKLEWDSKHLKAKNCPEADQFIQHHYRKGWKL
ncbi:MAG: Oxidoreductase domain protein [Verrucomicrobiales bacterium]|nr:Oxidoreductase domain protein [Verrucomicrobiales bacterium]